ncbi:uncharacterized protein TNCV_395011 [Trichonephila clavipes]|nr:uncharacterized protein TNCV_395011 [Trichonephila clavipes]
MFSQLCLKITIFRISASSTSETANSHWVSNLGCMGVTPDFSSERLPQFMRFMSRMGPGIVVQKDDTFTRHARPFSLDGFT